MALDLNQLQHLNDVQKANYMQAEKFFSSEFWPWLKKWAETNEQEQTGRILNANNWEFNRVATGARFAFAIMANLETVTENEFAALAEQTEEATKTNVEEENE